MWRYPSRTAWFHRWFRLGFACCSDARCGVSQAELLGFTFGFALVALVALMGDVALPRQICLVSHWFRLGFACCYDRWRGEIQAELRGFTLGFALVSLVALMGDSALPMQNCLVSPLASPWFRLLL